MDAVTGVLASADGLAEAVKIMLLEGLPHAAKEGCSHAYQKEFMSLAGGVLAGSKRSSTEEAASIDAALKALEGDLEVLKATEAESTKAVEEATEATEAAKATCEEAAKVAKEAEKEHEVEQAASAFFLKKRQQDMQERSRVAAIVEGALRMLVDGGWDDEEIKAESLTAVEGLLGDVKADKVVMAAAPHALCKKPDDRMQYDTMVVDEVAKTLPAHLSDLESKLKASEEEEVNKTSEILGLWAIADCARDSSKAAGVALLLAQEKQSLAELELNGGRKRAIAQEEQVAESAAKRARVTERLAAVEEAEAAVGRLAAGAPESNGDATPGTAEAEAEAEAEAGAA